MNKLELSFLEPLSVSNLEAKAWEVIKDADSEAAMTPARNRSNVTYEELELIASLRQWEEAAFATLVERYHGRLLRFTQSFVPSQAVAEEVVQETWMAVLKGVHRFEERENAGICHLPKSAIQQARRRMVGWRRNGFTHLGI